MIEVNLLPGGRKRVARRPRVALPVPSMKGLPGDKWSLGVAALGIVLGSAAAYLHLSTGRRIQELTEAVEAAAADSAQFADLIQAMDRLRARRDSVAQRVEILQEIDGGRYIWPHILDEVSGALPDYTWLTGLVQLSGPPSLRFQLAGNAGNNFALTQFMRNLEASPFIRGVRLISTEQVMEAENLVHAFSLEADYETPPPELIETVPLFTPVAGEGAGAPDGGR